MGYAENSVMCTNQWDMQKNSKCNKPMTYVHTNGIYRNEWSVQKVMLLAEYYGIYSNKLYIYKPESVRGI